MYCPAGHPPRLHGCKSDGDAIQHNGVGEIWRVKRRGCTDYSEEQKALEVVVFFKIIIKI